MTRDSMLALLRGWAPSDTPYGRKLCEQCFNDRCDEHCKLAEAIRWLEDEGNAEDTFESVGYEYLFTGKGHVLR